MNEEDFALISNRVFYTPTEENGLSILEQIKRKDGKVLLILYYLYMEKNINDITKTTLKVLIEESGYKSSVRENVKSFKEVLFKLKEIGVIDFSQEIKDKNTLIEINCKKLLDINDKSSGYKLFFVLEKDEIELIKSNTSNNQKFITCLKVYCYLKARVRKIDFASDIAERGFKDPAEVTWRSYEDITKYTGVSNPEIEINKLKEIGLIMFDNAGSKIKDGVIKCCSNVYSLTRVSQNPKLELEEGMKQYIYFEKNERGYTITKKDNNDYIKKIRSEAGKKSSLMKKIKKGTATKREIKQYNKIVQIEKERHEKKESVLTKRIM